jgi:hypothetical protein
MRAWVHPELHKSASLPSKTASVLAQRFLELVRSIGLERTPRAPILQEGDDSWRQTLGRLVESIDALAKQRKAGLSSRQEAFEAWLWEGALLLATPESGLPADTANELLSTWFSLLERKRHPRMKKRLKQGRRMRAAALLSDVELHSNESVESILERIDLQSPEFEWAYLIEGRPPSIVEMTPELRVALQRIPVRHPRKSSAQGPETLARYIEALGIQPHIATRSKPRMDDLADTLTHLASSQATSSAALQYEQGRPQESPELVGPFRAGANGQSFTSIEDGADEQASTRAEATHHRTHRLAYRCGHGCPPRAHRFQAENPHDASARRWRTRGDPGPPAAGTRRHRG